jgi:GNAT superfamily N-acetyltransferase
VKLEFIFAISLFVLSVDALEYIHIKKSHNYAHEINIGLYDDNKHIGCMSYTKPFFLPIYVIHSLYVYPQYRRKGYGRALLLYGLDVIEKQGAWLAYIQPGPFEMMDDNEVKKDSTLYQQKIKDLIAFYKKCGFHSVGSVVSKIAGVFYRIIGIEENARYLMVKKF